jgi:hypothetical protein
LHLCKPETLQGADHDFACRSHFLLQQSSLILMLNWKVRHWGPQAESQHKRLTVNQPGWMGQMSAKVLKMRAVHFSRASWWSSDEHYPHSVK